MKPTAPKIRTPNFQRNSKTMVNAILGMGYDLPQRLDRIEAILRDLSTQPILRHASTGQDGGQGLTTDINGLHLFNPAGTEVVTLSTLDGSATLGNTTITGNLSVPNGSITNAALQNPLTTGSAGYTATNQSFTTTSTVYGTQNITVPSGYTQALVMNGVSGGGTNNGAGGDYIYVSSDINGSGGGETPTYAAAGYYASASAFGIRTLTGLSGGSITVGVRVRTGVGAWAAAAANVVNVNALVIFYR